MKSIQKNNERLSLVVLAPVTAKYSGRMFVLVEDFAIDGPDDAVIKMTRNLSDDCFTVTGANCPHNTMHEGE